ncbi:MAG TPA: VWA domain-containing protein [Bryobacteraceae bacterium]|jgi:uncharacterized protein YegL|nr:VWA domain-containing protein [Bryobacteraceae bacterium]
MLNPEFAINADPRCACLLLLDTSSSMEGERIRALNEGLRAFEGDIQEDSLARRRVEIAIITFGGSVDRVLDFTPAGSFQAPTLSARGATPMGRAITEGVQLVKDRKAEYKSNGVLYYQPWIFMITDGEPTDEWEAAAKLTRAEAAAKSLTFFAVGVGEANTAVLKQITDRVLKLDGLKFRELFIWLSQSQQRVSSSKVGEQTPLPSVGFGSPVGG